MANLAALPSFESSSAGLFVHQQSPFSSITEISEWSEGMLVELQVKGSLVEMYCERFG